MFNKKIVCILLTFVENEFLNKICTNLLISFEFSLDLVDEACDGNQALINPITGQDYNCSQETCPPNSYCHLPYGKCCKEGT